ncbi:hypothetical protein [Endozoicomonas ascidiicola]|uniref:hypothetical protein n=1 Tax=Endozoicomonas ascidiicola TaxID=1698521 RepID=UPI00083018A4|nr:hypothetical protein [Endozoicomonas ascidiicola]
MRTIDLSVMQRYGQKRIREEIADSENVAENVRPDSNDGERRVEGIDHGTASNELSGSHQQAEEKDAEFVTQKQPVTSADIQPFNYRRQNVEIPEVDPFEGTEDMSPEELEAHLKEHNAREEIKSNWEVEQGRIEAERNKQLLNAETELLNSQRKNKAARDSTDIDIETKKQQAKYQSERAILAEEAKTQDLRNQIELQNLETQQVRLDQESQRIKNREREHQLKVDKRREVSEARRQKGKRIFHTFLMILFAILLLLILAAIAHRMWRWSVEEPLIKEVVEEVIVEKEVIEEVIKEVEVEKEVIPPECTQIRRNGKVYVSCDGVTIDGAPTISESGVEVPELLGDPN